MLHHPVQAHQLRISFTPDTLPRLLHSLHRTTLLRTKLSMYNCTTPVSCPVVAKWESPAPELVSHHTPTSHTRDTAFSLILVEMKHYIAYTRAANIPALFPNPHRKVAPRALCDKLHLSRTKGCSRIIENS